MADEVRLRNGHLDEQQLNQDNILCLNAYNAWHFTGFPHNTLAKQHP
jgi:hypothetical protein